MKRRQARLRKLLWHGWSRFATAFLLFFLQPLGPAETLQAANAQISIYCDSVQFHYAEASVGETTYYLGVGSPPFDASDPNGDLAPFDVKSIGVANTLGSLYVLRTPGEVFFDDFFLPTPDFSDSNANGIDDFFEPEIGLSGISSMGYIEDGVQGTQFPLHATWYRDSSKTTGMCRVLMQNANLPRVVPFEVNYELIVFSGSVTYVRGSTNVLAQVQLTQVGSPTHTLTGLITLSPNDPDTVSGSSGQWTDEVGRVSPTQLYLPLRRLGSNYVGVLKFPDGLPATTSPHRRFWTVRITDGNDRDGNGIPDFSDVWSLAPDPGTVSLGADSGGLQLSVFSRPGAVYQLETRSSLDAGGWHPIGLLTMTNHVSVFRLELPRDSGASFWRLTSP